MHMLWESQGTNYHTVHLEPARLYGCFHVYHPPGFISATSLLLLRLSRPYDIVPCFFPSLVARVLMPSDVFLEKILFLRLKLIWLKHLDNFVGWFMFWS